MHVCLGGEGLARNDERRFVLSVLDSLLGWVAEFPSVPGGARETRTGVQHLLVLEHVSGRPVSAASTSAAVPIAWVRSMETVDAPNCERLGRESVPFDELRRAKEHLKGRIILGLESTSSRMTRLGKAVLIGTEILSLDQLADRVDRVTADDVQSLAQLALSLRKGCQSSASAATRSVFEAAVPAGRAPAVIRLEQGAS